VLHLQSLARLNATEALTVYIVGKRRINEPRTANAIERWLESYRQRELGEKSITCFFGTGPLNKSALFCARLTLGFRSVTKRSTNTFGRFLNGINFAEQCVEEEAGRVVKNRAISLAHVENEFLFISVLRSPTLENVSVTGSST